MNGSLPKLFAAMLAVLSVLALTGCNTLNSRVREHESMFRALDPATQQKLREHKVEIGYTPDMVYIALGRPTTQREHVTEKGRTLIWIYSVTHTEYAGTVVERQSALLVDRRTGRKMIVSRPVVTNVYEEDEEDVLRIVFKDGLVSEIESNR